MSNSQVETGPLMPPDEEATHQEELRKVYLEQAVQSVEGIEATIKSLQESLKTARAELKRLKDGGRV